MERANRALRRYLRNIDEQKITGSELTPDKKPKTKSRILAATIAFAFAAFFLSSCNDRPSEIGFPLIYDTVSVLGVSSADADFVVDRFNYRIDGAVFNSIYYVGQAEGTHCATYTTIHFTELPDTLDYLEVSNIESATLSIYPNQRVYGDTTNEFGFKIYRYTRFDSTTTWSDIFPDNMGAYLDLSKELAAFRGYIEYKDTMDPIVMDFDKQTVVNWLKERATDYDTVFRGYAIVPDEDITSIRQFTSFTSTGTADIPDSSYKARVEVAFTNAEGEPDTITIKSDLQTTFANSDDYDDMMDIQGMIAKRSTLKFDFRDIPDQANIHLARLELTVDTTRILASNLGLYEFLAADAVGDMDPTDEVDNFDDYTGVRLYDGDVATDKFYFPNLARSVQFWIDDGDKEGILAFYVSSGGEFSLLDRIPCYDHTATDPSKRPYFKIIYSKRPDFDD